MLNGSDIPALLLTFKPRFTEFVTMIIMLT
jgi:hypothetical protein